LPGNYKSYNEDARLKHEASYEHVSDYLARKPYTVTEVLADAQFWFESCQNWQSEFFSIAILDLLSIHLRQKGSSQSKRLYASSKIRAFDHSSAAASPAFDLNPFSDRIRELKTWLSAEIGPQASIAGVLEFATYCRISDTKAQAMLAKIEKAVATWRAVGKTLGMTKSELDDFGPAFEHTEREVARRRI
jgi:hypothetical protein